MDHSLEVIFNHLRESPDPDMAFSYFEDFIVNSTAKSTIFELIVSFRVIGKIIFGLFSQSNTLSVFLINNTELIFWLIENKTLSQTKGIEEFKREAFELIETLDNPDKQEYLLRVYRKKQYLRIAVREIVDACGFDEIMRELSCLACALIDASILVARERLKKRFGGVSHDGFCVIGMGKLGNMELNFSSDIDLLFVHRERELSEYYNRLASMLISVLSSNREGGFIYRVDMRLRPGGEASALSMTPDEYEKYYEALGQPWERMALVKANFAAGDPALGREFLSVIDPFVYRKSIDIEYIKEIRRLLFKIRKHTRKVCEDPPLDQEKMDVKKGKGGIREVEFIVNYFQLIYGGKYESLKRRSTLDALKIIEEKSLLGADRCMFLSEAYLFLRRVEHKLQLFDEQQTQALPCDPKGLKRLARSLNMDVNGFVEKYNTVTDGVHEIFRSVFVVDHALPVFSAPEDIEGFLEEHGIPDPKSITNIVVDAVRRFVSRDINKEKIEEIFDYTFRFVPPVLLERCMMGLARVEPLYTEAFFNSPALFDIYLKLLSAGFGDRVAKIGDPLELIFSGDVEDFEPDSSGFNKATVLTAFRFLMEPEDLENPTHMSRFAVKYINHLCAKNGVSGLGVVAYGKLATGELFVGSDLDLIFVSSASAHVFTPMVQRFIRKLKRFYDVDLKLRPYGEKGELVVDTDYLEAYFRKNARAWEKQAAQKSKIVCADNKLRERLRSIYDDFVLKNPPSREDILSMKMKIEEFKGGKYDIKSSPGGLTDIEFIAQAVCFENRCAAIGASTLELLNMAYRAGFKKAEELKNHYKFLSSVLNANRLIFSDSSVREYDVLEFMLSKKHLESALEHTKKRVRAIFKEVFSC